MAMAAQIPSSLPDGQLKQRNNSSKGAILNSGNSDNSWVSALDRAG